MSASPSKKKSNNKPGLFDDLVDLTEREIDERAKSIRASIAVSEKEYESLQSERATLIALVQSLREIQDKYRGNSKERSKHLGKFRNLRSKADKIRAERDAINESVPPPLEIIEQRLAQTYRRLAMHQNDLVRMPNTDHEIRLFTFFFELQQMHSRKSHGNKLHQQYVELLREQESKLKELDRLTAEKNTDFEQNKGGEDEPIDETQANPKEIRRMNKQIAAMLENIREQRDDIKKLRREAGRLEAGLRLKKKKGLEKKRNVGPRLEDVKQRAISGEKISLDDLGALLKGGGLSKLSSEGDDKKSGSSSSGKTKRRQATAKRGTRRRTTTEERERRRG
ncbi:MAG: hypothetical protein QF440_06180 [Candidatus Thalassarchaeaceae archaeon]|jgi:hypothetical protein|nr:hypothetical protein [Candidatus Thalassarchaeaceae archaeon]